MHPEKYSIRLQRSHNRLCSPLLIRRTKLSEEATVSIEESKTFLANFPSEFELRFFESERERERAHPASSFFSGRKIQKRDGNGFINLKNGKGYARYRSGGEERREGGGKVSRWKRSESGKLFGSKEEISTMKFQSYRCVDILKYNISSLILSPV